MAIELLFHPAQTRSGKSDDKKKTFYVILIDFLCVMFSVCYGTTTPASMRAERQEANASSHTHACKQTDTDNSFFLSKFAIPTARLEPRSAIYLEFPFRQPYDSDFLFLLFIYNRYVTVSPSIVCYV